MKSWIKLVFLFLSFSCGDFNYSPYIVDTKAYNLNAKNLNTLKANESSYSNSFKVALISDPHDYYDELSKVVKIFNKRNDYAMILVPGDLTNLGQQSEYKATHSIMKKLDIPYLTTIGNHDLLTNGNKLYRKFFGEYNYSFSFKNTTFILFNNNNWESSDESPDFEWLEQQLQNSSTHFKVLLAHIPPDSSERFSAQEIQRMRDLVASYSVDYFICGHNHNYGVG